MNPRIEGLRQKLQQLKALHDTGTLGSEAYAAACQPLERELVDEVVKGQATPEPRSSWRLRGGLAAAVLLIAIAGYSLTGSPGSAGLGPTRSETSTAAPADDGSAPIGEPQVAEIVERVAQRLKEKPDDAAGWVLLARAYAAMGRPADAAPAFQKALALTGEDAGLLADYADTLAAQNNGQFTPESIKLVERALVLEPDNVKALALSGSAAFDNGEFAQAVRQWEKVERNLPADSKFLPQVRASIAQARERGGLAAVAASAGPAPAASAVATTRTAGVSGSVSLAPALAASASPNDTVFILARAAVGPRMPLAVLRKQVKDLPLNFTLDDSMAMAPTAKISDHAKVVVIARVSKSGDAMPKPGDMSGQSAAVAPGATGVAVSISELVTK